MKRFSLAIIAAACAVVFALSGCAGHKADAESLKGFWQTEEGAAIGFEAALNLDEDNLAELMLADTYLEGTWSTNGSEATIEFEDAANAKVYLSGDKLVLGADDGSKLVMVKGDMDAYFGEDSNEIETELEGVEGLEGALGDELEVVDEVIDDIEPVTIADDDVCTITVTGKGTDFTGDPGYRLVIKNKAKKSIYVVADEDFTVDGKSIEAGIGEVVDAGEDLETFMYFSADDLGGSTEKLKNVEGKLFVGDDESSDELATYTFKMD